MTTRDGNATTRRRLVEAVETPLNEAEIVELGLDEAPADIGLSWVEIERRRMRHG